MKKKQKADLLVNSLALLDAMEKYFQPDSGGEQQLALSITLVTFYNCLSDLLESEIEEPLHSLLESKHDYLAPFFMKLDRSDFRFPGIRCKVDEEIITYILRPVLEDTRDTILRDIFPLLGVGQPSKPYNLAHFVPNVGEAMVKRILDYAAAAKEFRHLHLRMIYPGLLIIADKVLHPSMELVITKMAPALAATLAIGFAFLCFQNSVERRRQQLLPTIQTAGELRQFIAQDKTIRANRPGSLIEAAEGQAKYTFWQICRCLRALKHNKKLLKNKKVASAVQNIKDVVCFSNSPLCLDPTDVLYLQYGRFDENYTSFIQGSQNNPVLETIFKKYLPKYMKFAAYGGDTEARTMEILSNSLTTLLHAVDPKRHSWMENTANAKLAS